MLMHDVTCISHLGATSYGKLRLQCNELSLEKRKKMKKKRENYSNNIKKVKQTNITCSLNRGHKQADLIIMDFAKKK